MTPFTASDDIDRSDLSQRAGGFHPIGYHWWLMRRMHVPQLREGEIRLDAAQSHHARDVLRLTVGGRVEAFDDAGAVAEAEIVATDPRVTIRVASVRRRESVMQLTIAAAVPKGERADWMIEKLSELGCSRFIPLATARSVVLPEGRNKRERWMRIATESAKQSRRTGVMQIDELTRLETLLMNSSPTYFLSTASDVTSITGGQLLHRLLLLVGPEGGWTEEEIALFNKSKVTAMKLTDTVLRVETAAIAAAAVVMTLASNRPDAT